MRRRLWLISIVLTSAVAASPLGAQSLDERLNTRDFLDGISSYPVPEVLQRYMQTHPPRNAIETAQYRMAAHRMRLADASLSVPERAEAIDALLAARASLIDSHPQHDDLAIWLTDQATDAFFLKWQDGGAGLTALFGVATDEQQRQAVDAVRIMLEYSRRAETAIEQTIVRIEDDPRFASDESLRLKRRELDGRDRRRRIPFLSGIAACLTAELQLIDDDQIVANFGRAAAALVPLAESLDGAPAAHARILGGLAQARLGQFDEAEIQFRTVATDPDARRIDAFAARMAAVINREVRGGPQAGLEAIQSIRPRYESEGDLFYRIILADRQLLLQMRIAASQPNRTQRETQAAAAANTYLSGASTLDQSFAMRSTFIEKLATVADDWPEGEPLPPPLRIAKANRALAREPVRSAEFESLQTMLDEPGVDSSLRAAALLAIGRAQWRAAQPREAVQSLLRLARDYTDKPESEAAIELAASIAASEYSAAPHSPQVQALLTDALKLLLQRFPNLENLDRWRLLAGRVAMQRGEIESAAAHFKSVPPGADVLSRLEAQTMLVQLRLTSAASPQAGRPSDELAQIVRDIDQALLSLPSHRAQVASESELLDFQRWESKMRILRAEALVQLGRMREADESIATLEQSGALAADVMADLLRVKLAAAQSQGRSDDVQRELRRYLDASPDDAASVLAGLLQGSLSSVQSLLNQARLDDARALARREAEPIAAMADQWLLQRGSSGHNEALSLLIADAFRQAEQFERALELYDALLARHPDSLQLLLGRADCLFGLGGERLGEAMTLYQRIAAAITDPGDSTYWQVQLRMLQILDKAERNTHQIVPQIRRLRLQDAALGGERYRRQFEALQNEYAR